MLFRSQKEATLNLEQQIITRYSTLEQARAQLASVLEIEDGVTLTDDPTRHVAILPALEDAQREALANRPELAQVEADFQQARMQHRAAKGDYYPQINYVLQGQMIGANSQSAAASPTVPQAAPASTGGTAAQQAAAQAAANAATALIGRASCRERV